MVNDKIKQLASYQEKVAELKQEIERERGRSLAHLHEDFGFASPQELIRAIRAAAGSRQGRRSRGRGARRHRKHTRITPEMKQKIKTALQAGQTGGKVAATFGISLPSVYNLKKAFGLVKARRKK